MGLPKIFLYPAGGSAGRISSVAVAEDGTLLALGYCPSTLHIEMEAKAGREGSAVYAAHYPAGYDLTYVPMALVEGHAELQAALALHHQIDEAMPRFQVA